MNYEATSMFTVESLVPLLSADNISSQYMVEAEPDLVSSSETLTFLTVELTAVLVVGIIYAQNKRHPNKEGAKT